MHLISLSTQVNRRIEYRHPLLDAPCVAVERSTSIFFRRYEIHPPVIIPIDCRRRHYAKISLKTPPLGIAQKATGSPHGVFPGADIFEPGKSIHPISAYDIQVSVAVPILKHRNRIAVYFNRKHVFHKDRLGLCPFFTSAGRSLVPYEIQHANVASVCPYAICVVGVIPSVRFSVANSHNDILAAIVVVIDKSPNISGKPFLSVIKGLFQSLELFPAFPTGLVEVGNMVLVMCHGDTPIRIGFREKIALPGSNLYGRFEHRERIFHSRSRRILEQPCPKPCWDTSAAYYYILVSVTLIIEYNNTANKSHLDKRTDRWIVVAKRREVVFAS